MNLDFMEDGVLLTRTEKLVRNERELLTNVLYHLREIDRRRLFSALGYKSIFDFAVRKLGYPEDQAYRRISAMRLLQEIPQLEKKINSGEISLTHIGLAQKFFRNEKKVHKKEVTKKDKLSLFGLIASKSAREAERITLALSSEPEISKPDRVKLINKDHIELKFVASFEVREKIERLKGLIAHQHPNISLGELFEEMCDLTLSRWESMKTAAPRKRCVKGNPTKASIRREIFKSANLQCEKCGSKYKLEVDHIIPRAKGGQSHRKNLRLLCRSCNQRAAIEEFGISKMDKFIN